MSRAFLVLVVLVAFSVTLLAAELATSAARADVEIANPCRTRAAFPGHGLDAVAQRIVLDGLDGAACRLHTSREELVLSLGNGERRWDEHTIETALRAGLLRAVDASEQRGDLPSFLAPLVRGVVERAPLRQLVEGGLTLRDLLG